MSATHTARPVAAGLGVGVIGLGFMGRQHIASYAAAHLAGWGNRLVAVCDPDPARRAGHVPAEGNAELEAETETETGRRAARLFDPAQVAAYARPEELLADPAVELVSICTYTDSHVPLGIAALAAGKHVLVEKPVALLAADAERLAAAARAAYREQGLLAMPALCMRFWPGWRWLRELLQAGELGAVRRATFRRFAPVPAWGREFYGDAKRCGGAAVDLHIHDADFLTWCFGRPAAVATTGSSNHVVTRYLYPGGPEVTAEGGWLSGPGASFFMGFRVEGERGVADYAFGRAPVLQLERGALVEAVPLPAGTGYDGEVRHLLEAVARVRAGERGAAPRLPPGKARATEQSDPPAARGAPPITLDATLDEAVALTRLLEAERRSLETGREVVL